jgi:hypothetical protein
MTLPQQQQPTSLFDESFNPMDKSHILPQTKGQIIIKIPEKIIFKLVKFSKEKTYIQMDYFKHKIGDSDKDTRDHVCQISIGNSSISPEKDMYFAARAKLKELKEARASEEAIRKQEVIVNKFKPITRAWLLIVTPNNPKLTAIRVPKSVVDEIFGVEEKYSSEYRPARKGILNEMLEDGRSPFDIKSNIGWLELTKTGTGINTRYHVKEMMNSVTKVEDKRKITYTEPGKAEVNPTILTLNTSDIPNIYDFERKFAFTFEEAKAFAASLGAEVPKRFLKTSNSDLYLDSDQSSDQEENLAEMSTSSIPVAKTIVSTDESEFTTDDEPLPF